MEEVLSRFGGISLEPADFKAILEAAVQSFTTEELEAMLVEIRNGKLWDPE